MPKLRFCLYDFLDGGKKGSTRMTVPSPVAHGLQTIQEWLKELKAKGELADEAVDYCFGSPTNKAPVNFPNSSVRGA